MDELILKWSHVTTSLVYVELLDKCPKIWYTIYRRVRMTLKGDHHRHASVMAGMVGVVLVAFFFAFYG